MVGKDVWLLSVCLKISICLRVLILIHIVSILYHIPQYITYIYIYTYLYLISCIIYHIIISYHIISYSNPQKCALNLPNWRPNICSIFPANSAPGTLPRPSNLTEMLGPYGRWAWLWYVEHVEPLGCRHKWRESPSHFLHMIWEDSTSHNLLLTVRVFCRTTVPDLSILADWILTSFFFPTTAVTTEKMSYFTVYHDDIYILISWWYTSDHDTYYIYIYSYTYSCYIYIYHIYIYIHISHIYIYMYIPYIIPYHTIYMYIHLLYLLILYIHIPYIVYIYIYTYYILYCMNIPSCHGWIRVRRPRKRRGAWRPCSARPTPGAPGRRWNREGRRKAEPGWRFMVQITWQCVKTLYPCSSHQNSWDLWMFIPLKMVLIGIDPYPLTGA